MRTVKQGTEGQDWNRTISEANGSFLQALEWGQFQESLGRRTLRLSTSSFQALLVRHDLPFGKSYLYCPRGPLLQEPQPSEASDKALSDFLEAVTAIQQQERSVFLKIEPQWENAEESIALLRAHGFIRSQEEIQPSQTPILDISQPEDAILDHMKKKTRYSVRLGARKGVTVRRLSPQAHDDFLELLGETAKRNRFRTHPRAYYKKMLESFQGEDQAAPVAELWGAEYEGHLLAANLVLLWGKRATWLHGASSSTHRDLMGPYILHWETIKEVRIRGYQEYDLWGISGRWPGVTHFKKGFGGEMVTYVGSYDLVLNRPWYLAYRLARRIL